MVGRMHHPIDHYQSPEITPPTDRRPLAGRHALPIVSAESTRLFWDNAHGEAFSKSHAEAGAHAPDVYFRIVCAIDDRAHRWVEVSNAQSGESYARMELAYAAPGQVYQCTLTPEQVAGAIRDGLALRLEGGESPIWIVAPGGPNTPDSILPSLSQASAPPSLDHFLRLFCTPASFQQWDWTGVCVLDGLQDWAQLGNKDAAQTLEQYLRTFIDPKEGRREDFRGHPCDDAIANPETGGPFAILIAQSPKHPSIHLLTEGFEHFHNKTLDYIGTHRLVTESNYNVAYPMMSLAVHLNRPDYKEKSLAQLRATMHYLTDDDNVWLRYDPENGERTFQNWSRGVAWYFLGMVRSLALLPKSEWPDALIAECNRMAAWVSTYQMENGLWAGFLHEKSVRPDNSGSAGIAAAIALGIRIGLIQSDWQPTAEKAYQGLSNCLTHDGWLQGVSQTNKPEALHMDIQRSDFRVIAPWGMGLYAQLAAALQTTESA